MIETARLLLRRWRVDDLPAFAEMNADPRVMVYFPRSLEPAESGAMAGRIQTQIDREGFGLWAVEVRGVAEFIGFVGLAIPSFEAHFTPCVEIGWRLAFDHWGRGYATEAALAVLEFGFGRLGLPEVVSFTAKANRRSRGVMERVGMTWDPLEDFDHPALPEGHPLQRHVFYRVKPTSR
jgi:RimJ/RimL family protein N-acetyltransferase